MPAVVEVPKIERKSGPRAKRGSKYVRPEVVSEVVELLKEHAGTGWVSPLDDSVDSIIKARNAADLWKTTAMQELGIEDRKAIAVRVFTVAAGQFQFALSIKKGVEF